MKEGIFRGGKRGVAVRLTVALCVGIIAALVAVTVSPAAVLWTRNGVAVCTNAAAQSQAVCAPDGSGGSRANQEW